MTVKSEYTYPEKVVIGTRGSPLALVQANMVKDEIVKIGQNIDVKLVIITTSGDWRPEDGEVRLQALEGGKAQFAKEIEEALLCKEIDIAVHSMKDMETILPEGLIIPFMLPREDSRDVLLSVNSQNILDLPVGCTVGTVSARRQAFLLNMRPDLNVVPLRGNVQTRIDKLKAGQVDATFLACAGLNRLGLSHEITSIIECDDMLPSVGQGAIGIEMRDVDMERLSFIGQFSCENTFICVECERSVLRALGGSCHTPIGVSATYDGGEIHLRVKIISVDGKDVWVEDVRTEIGSYADAVQFGSNVGERLKDVVPKEVLG
ncbi:MAG: hydroxymethylbilane synthase [Zetaproteobacteria bacterium]|nr:MAG: hydroxymethylbilane synthase [Zetaproteobacteria bacterium]